MKKTLVGLKEGNGMALDGVTVGKVYEHLKGDEWFLDNSGQHRGIKYFLWSDVFIGCSAQDYAVLAEGADQKISVGSFEVVDKADRILEDVTFVSNLAGLPKLDEHDALTYHSLPCDKPDIDKAMRFNSGKTPLSYMLDADVAMAGMCRVMEFGAKKYARGNWKKGLDPVEVMDSLLRHLTAYQSGEILDPESNLPHIDHVLCNAVFLSTFGKREET